MLVVRHHGEITSLRLARTLAGRVLHDVYAYFAGGVLIDSGPPATAKELAAWFGSGAASPPVAIVNTHHHEDHVGGDALVAKRFGIPVHAASSTVELLARKRRIPFYRWLIWGGVEPCAAQPLPETVELGALRLQVVPTPGHAFDHVCLFEERRGWLFSGDLFVHERVRFLRRIEDPWLHLDSLRRVLALEPRLMLCSHAGVIDEARGALTRKIAFWEQLADSASELAERGFSSSAIARRLLGREGLFTYLSLGDFSKRNLVLALTRRRRRS